MAFSADSASFYTNRGGAGGSGAETQTGGFQGPHHGFRALPNVRGGGSVAGSTFSPEEPQRTDFSHGMSIGSSHGAGGVPSSGEPVKRKRGRPRKYGPDGPVSLRLSATADSSPGSSTPAEKRPRGRPPGSGRKQQLASLGIATTEGEKSLSSSDETLVQNGEPSSSPLASLTFPSESIVVVEAERVPKNVPGTIPTCFLEMVPIEPQPPYPLLKGEWMNSSAGQAFSPHVITIEAGEDIVAKLLSFSQQRPRAVCILSGTGTVSSVTLRQPASTTVSVTFEGRFQILCLSGSYLVAEDGGPRSRTGGMSVSLSSPDGHVIGGGVAMLIAASPMQVVVCSFVYGSSKTKQATATKDNSSEPKSIGKLASLKSASPPNQNYNSSVTGIWPGSRPADMKSAHPHTGIDLTRG